MAEILQSPVEFVQQMFKDEEDPTDAITNIQKENRVKVTSLQPAFFLMDLHDLTRREIHLSILQTLKEMLISKLEILEPRAMKRLLDKSFAYVSVPELRSVVMRILETMPRPVNERYLLDIAEKEDLYQDCPMSIKQDIWRLNPGVFGEAVSPLLDQYVAEKESVLFAVFEEGKEPVGYLKIPPKTRRQNLVLKQLVEMLGSSVPLYNTLCQFLRTLFVRTHISHYSTLRSDLIMLLHEQDNEITDSDRCHKFAWCLDACIKASLIDDKKLKELYAFLDSIEGGDDVLEDVSMMLYDPYAQNAISLTIVQILTKMVADSQLPRENHTVESLVRLLSIGMSSISYLDTKSYTGDPLDADVMTKFLPELLTIIIEAQLKNTHIKLKQDYPLYTPSHHFQRHLSAHPVAMQITCSYVLHLLEKKDFRTMSTILPAMAKVCQASEGMAFSEGFLHMFIVGLSGKMEAIKETQVSVILKEFFLACAGQSESVLLYLCRLLWAVHHKIKPSLLNEVLEEMEPGDVVNMAAQEQYLALLKRVEESNRTEEMDTNH